MSNQSIVNDQPLAGIPSEPVGSVPRPLKLQEAMKAYSQGDITTEAMDALLDSEEESDI